MTAFASFERELRRVVEGDVLFDRGSLAVYSTDASVYRQVAQRFQQLLSGHLSEIKL